MSQIWGEHGTHSMPSAPTDPTCVHATVIDQCSLMLPPVLLGMSTRGPWGGHLGAKGKIRLTLSNEPPPHAALDRHCGHDSTSWAAFSASVRQRRAMDSSIDWVRLLIDGSAAYYKERCARSALVYSGACCQVARGWATTTRAGRVSTHQKTSFGRARSQQTALRWKEPQNIAGAT